MSTNRTENYQLHAWEPGDDFLLREINENFAALDMSARFVAGTYSGNGAASQGIELGFAPKAVLVVDERGYVTHNSYYCGGLALPGGPVRGAYGTQKFMVLELEGQGFRVYYRKLDNNTYACTNQSNVTYYYIALM